MEEFLLWYKAKGRAGQSDLRGTYKTLMREMMGGVLNNE
jgi:hypothetical protein